MRNKMIEKQQWKEIAMGVSPNMSGDRVQSSSSQQKMADAMNRYIDLDREIDAAIDALAETKRDIVAVIEQLPAKEYDLLHMIYVQGKDLVDVADAYNKSYSWAKSLHGTALQRVNKILDKKESDNG